MPHPDPHPLVDRLAGRERVVEIGVGRRPGVARALAARDVDVTATDVVARDVPESVRFVVDDVTDPDSDVYAGAEALYALNFPPELHRPALELARDHGAELLFTTLGGEQPAIPVERETIATGTLFRVRPESGSEPTGDGPPR